MQLPVVTKENISGKKVLVRGDIDVPLLSGKITDDSRLLAIKPTLDFLLENNAEVILCGHIGRPKGVDPELSTKPIQDFFPEVKVLENLRFDLREESNDPEFARGLAAMADVYVNEAFASSERAHASIVGVPKLLPHFAGFRLAKEIEVLSLALENPKHPMLVIIGGIKWETKEPVVKKMETIADNVVTTKTLTLTPDTKDVTLDSIEKIKDLIANAATIIWNGPVGMVEDFTYQVGTRRIAELIAHNETAYKIVGGGDTVAFIKKLGLEDKFNWVSTGGGSMLKFLSGEELPGVEALFN